ncbi:MAG: transcriptional regulator [unclassified Hahellaceae]|nr:transcriptional regulator [Hahellaceae bacterium]|tara:strand:+ start:193069 stop:194688 length:1620 start_codon:yes stop_codon:yes gene_type:complete
MKTVVFSIVGSVMDNRGRDEGRWERWRPTVSLCQHDDVIIDRLELLYDNHTATLAEQTSEDVSRVSPETEVRCHRVNFRDAWDFESVYGILLDFARSYRFDTEVEQYLIHITTGTHVAQICLYLLTEAGYLPGKLIQTGPPRRGSKTAGTYQVIDLDLSKYDQIASRFRKEHDEGQAWLKGGIETANADFNRMIDQLELVCIRSNEPILLTGPTGAGKSQLAQRVYALKKQRAKLSGELVSVNCATLRGDGAMSALFGHRKGAFTGAVTDRIGLLKKAHGGMLFLDEIGELGLDEQAMLLRAIEEKVFTPFGADKEVSSDFQLIAGTNKDLASEVRAGRFREDLLARIDLWCYRLPSLRERIEDLVPNIEFELETFASKSGSLVSFNKDARERYMKFSHSAEASWSANFRDLNASITRMATLADGGRITSQQVQDEIERLRAKWRNVDGSIAPASHDPQRLVSALIGEEACGNIDLFDQATLAAVLQACRSSSSMAEAGRKLFSQSRKQKSSSNDSHRVKQILDRYGVRFADIRDRLRD